jgi:NAD(P)-dependent dehydrogenase (short-subunit alcohol dehydrogenase family)
MVTGGTDGIGKAPAVGLARMSATVIITGRNAQKADRVVEEIRATTGYPNVSALIADFAALDQVRKLAETVRARYDRLDVLVNNAGLVTRTRQESQDGYELMFAVNHLAPFLLTTLLLDLLKAGAPARVVNVSSFGYKRGAIHFDDLQFEQHFDHRQAYYQTRLGSVLFTLALARRLEGTGVTANVLHPGIVKTNLSHNYMGNPVFRFFEQLIAISPEQGAQTSLYLAAAPEVEHVTGSYFEKQQRKPLSETASDRELQERLWQVSAALVGLGAAQASAARPHTQQPMPAVVPG